MPQYRKLYTKVTQSFDFNDMPDDFTRCVWLLLPLGLDREGRGIFNGSWIKSRLMPLRTDVDIAQIMQAMDWFGQHGLIEVYEVDERSYFRVPTFKKYQGDTHKELESMLPPPPNQPQFRLTPESVWSDSRVSPEPLQSESRVTPEPVWSDSSASLESLQSRSCTDSDSNADSDVEADAEASASTGREAIAGAFDYAPAMALNNPAGTSFTHKPNYLKIFHGVTGKWGIPNDLKAPFYSAVDGLLENYAVEEIIPLMKQHFERWYRAHSPSSDQLDGSVNTDWLTGLPSKLAGPPTEPEPA